MYIYIYIYIKFTVVPPEIVNQPDNVIVAEGDPVTFTVEATGMSLTYQWFLGNTPLADSTWPVIAGATSSTLMLESAAVSDAGMYTVTVTNDAGMDTSNPATLVVGECILAEPGDLCVIVIACV